MDDNKDNNHDEEMEDDDIANRVKLRSLNHRRATIHISGSTKRRNSLATSEGVKKEVDKAIMIAVQRSPYSGNAPLSSKIREGRSAGDKKKDNLGKTYMYVFNFHYFQLYLVAQTS